MQSFKVEVSKGLKKYTIIRKAFSENDLKEQLHKEGFSILSISVFNEERVSGNKFYFEVLVNGEIKKGTISSNDIFKAYLKIKYDLKYDLKYLYYNENTTLEEKEKIIYELKEKEKIYKDINKKDLEKKQKEQEKILKITKNEEKIDSFKLKKDLEKVYSIIDKVLSKIKFILEDKEIEKFLKVDKKLKLKDIYNALITLKSSNNLEKLKQISITALKKIGEVELELIELKKSDETRMLLKETNTLLKQIGSRESFVEKEKDINYILSNFLKEIKLFFEKKQKKEKKIIDTTSSVFLKTKLLYNLYEKKKKQIQKEMYEKFYIFLIPNKKNKELKENYFLKLNIINQNLIILKKRITDEEFSYVKLKKGYLYFIEKFLNLLNFLKNPIYFIIYLYSLIFIFAQILVYFGYNINLNFYGLFYFLFLIFSYFLLKKVKGILTFGIFVVFLNFIFIVGVINF